MDRYVQFTLGGTRVWRAACKILDRSVHPVLLKTNPASGPVRWDVIGSAFCINHEHNPTFITNAHVVHDNQGKPFKDELLGLITMGPGGFHCGLSVMIFEKDLDIAVLEASKEASIAQPVAFAPPQPVEIGSAVASMGYPIPNQPEMTQTGGSLQITRRLATGFLSNESLTAKMPDWPWTDALKHYELNMLSYPGISGAPVFGLEGRVIAVNRGSRLHEGYVAAYAIAIRNADLHPLLDKHHVKYEIR